MKNNNKYKRITFGIFIFFSFGLVTGNAQASAITKDKVIELVNKDRISQGLERVFENSALSRAASDKADDMIANKYFAHTSPAGISPWFWFDQNKYDYKFAGENLAIDFKDADKQQTAWMKSEKHRKNILNSAYKEIGIAVKEGNINGHKSIITVQLFGAREGFVAPIEAKPEVAIKNDKVLGAETNIPLVNNQSELASGMKGLINSMQLHIYQIISLAMLIAFAYAGLIFLSFKRHNVEHVDVEKLYKLDINNIESYFDLNELMADSERLQPVYVTSRKNNL